MIYRLIYKSKFNENTSFGLLAEIMEKSKKKNEALGITGFLLATDEEFLQVLEGSFKTVNELYHTIVQDQRHNDIRLISFDAVTERAFPEWTMNVTQLIDLKQPYMEILTRRYGSKDGRFKLPIDKYESYALLRDVADINKDL